MIRPRRCAPILVAALTILACSCSTPAATTTASRARSGQAPTPATADCTHVASSARLNAGPDTETFLTSSGSPGAIAGSLEYPSEGLPPLLVYAVSTSGVGRGSYSVETIPDQGSYVIKGVAPGMYYVFSVSRGDRQHMLCATWGGIYSRAVPCGLQAGCNDHSPIPVTVNAGQTTRGILVADYYWSPGEAMFVPPPPAVVPDHPAISTGGEFPNAAAAAANLALGRSIGESVRDMNACPAGIACVVVGGEVEGTNAAYFVGAAGSNGITFQCGTYVYRDQVGWHALRWRCSSTVYPAIGASGSVTLGMGALPTDCAHVRAAPSLAGGALACLRDGTPITVDGGPVYAPGPNINGLWWHIRGRGWMADNFVTAPFYGP